MPYSDNLYSATTDDEDDGHDHESFSNELSPTDGFFAPSPVPNQMVADPSLDRKDRDDEDKVLIPSNETRNESGSASRSTASSTLGQLFPSQNRASPQAHNRPFPPPPPSSLNNPSSPSSYRRPGNHIFPEPNHSMQGPPPAYTPSSPTTTSSPSTHDRSYSTFDPHRLEQGLTQEPQSMGGPAEDPNEYTPLSDYSIRKPSRRRLAIKHLLLVCLVIAIAIGTMTTLLDWGRSISKKDPNLPGGEIPVGKKPPSLGLPNDGHGPYCASATIHRGESFYDFSLEGSLGVVQSTYDPDHGHGGRNVRTTGEIKLRKLPKDSEYSSRGLLEVNINVSDDGLEIRKTWDEKTRTMTISTPKIAPFSSDYDVCISLEVTVWLPEHALLSALSIESTTLNLKVFDDVKIKVNGDAEFVSVSGDIFFPKVGTEGKAPPKDYPLDSRHITVETVSGDIKGVYPLYDYLKLGSQSGDIIVGVYPQPVLPSDPAPADLEVSTASGKIQVTLPAEIPRYNPPPRDYVTHVSSISGDISGSYFLGSVGTFKSTSGDMTAKVLPVIQYSPSTDPDDAPESLFDTWSVSGTHKFDVLDPTFISLLPSNKVNPQPDRQHSPEPYIPIGDDDPYRLLPPELNEDDILEERRIRVVKKWRTLKANHHSSSADITLRYPVAWEGTVSGKTVSGDIKVDGKDMKVITYKKGWAYKELVAAKGASKIGEGSSVGISAISGDLKFVVGEVE